MVIAAIPSISLGPSHCHFCHSEGIGCSTSYGITGSLIKSPFEGQRVSDHSGVSFRCGNPFFGATQFHWLPVGREICLSKVSVAADYSDSVPDSSNYVGNHGYHPLEELKVRKQVRETKLTSAEIARNTVEANSSALLVFPGTVHCEPHEQISWAEFQYIVDEYGDIFFEIFDDENILQDHGASNPVNALFGMDNTIYENRRAAAEYNISDSGASDDIPFNDDYFEVEGSEMSDIPVEWGMPDTSSLVHPIYFAKCLTKSFSMEYVKKMDHPSNGVSILGCLRPAFIDEELYLRRLFNGEDSDGYTSDCKDGEILSFSSSGDGKRTSSTVYKLEIMRIELFSVYGVQSAISLQDFQDAEPDVLVLSTPDILERFNEKGMRCNIALKALCKKRGLHVEATSEDAAEKQILQLLFPRSRRKKFRSHGDELRDPDSF
uniref:Putative Pentatricopeptide repeat (PPR) superfamily protein isoform 2 n=1 Tax=Davidia involucrata TaxID=16924 RepID=A0A5B7AA62_DAVIN